ncbi:FAD/NAD(P)-binding protein [Pediococcus claussenii]|nr:FAD/NAD(P)-binding protein [Pediococcus claussenii]
MWTPSQNLEYKMNSLASKITLYNDSSVEIDGPIVEGPTLYQWAKQSAAAYIEQHDFARESGLLQEVSELDQLSYSSRALFGVYQWWYYDQLIAHLPANIHIQKHLEQVSNVHRKDDDLFVVISDSSAYEVSAVSAALGEGTDYLSQEEEQLSEFAKEHDLTYVPAAYINEVDIDDIAPNDSVIIRGLGLSFVDYLSDLTERRGGVFDRDDNGDMIYHRSGDEPTIYASSRRGLPYHARALDQKIVGETSPRHFLSDQFITQLIDSDSQISGKQFMHLIQLEMSYSYYVHLVKNDYPRVKLDDFKKDLLASNEKFASVLDKYDISQNRFSWDKLVNPLPNNIKDSNSFTEFVKTYLKQDIENAKRGNKTDPISSAFEKLRELRTNIRKVVSYNLISNDDFLNIFLREFNNANSFLSVGPPIFRIEQVLALIKASVLTLVGPDMEVFTEENQFAIKSGLLNDKVYHATALIEGRLPAPDARRTTNSLIQNLIKSGLGRIYQLELSNGTTFQTGAIDTTADTAELISTNGLPVKNFFVWGLSTEQRHWLTNGSPIPGVNDIRLRMADKIGSQVAALLNQAI